MSLCEMKWVCMPCISISAAMKIWNKYHYFLNKAFFSVCILCCAAKYFQHPKKSIIFTFINDLSAEYILFSASSETLCTYFALNRSCCSSQLTVQALVFHRTDTTEK